MNPAHGVITVEPRHGNSPASASKYGSELSWNRRHPRTRSSDESRELAPARHRGNSCFPPRIAVARPMRAIEGRSAPLVTEQSGNSFARLAGTELPQSPRDSRHGPTIFDLATDLAPTARAIFDPSSSATQEASSDDESTQRSRTTLSESVPLPYTEQIAVLVTSHVSIAIERTPARGRIEYRRPLADRRTRVSSSSSRNRSRDSVRNGLADPLMVQSTAVTLLLLSSGSVRSSGPVRGNRHRWSDRQNPAG